MPTVADMIERISARTSPENAADWDPVGLQLGDPGAEVHSIAVCHEVSESVVQTIENSPVDLLISYHPLLFTPINRLVAGRSPSARALRIAAMGVSLMITHTDFDACEGGAADALAAALQLRETLPFGGDEDEGRADIGRVGTFGGSLDALDALVTDLWGSNGLRISGDREALLERVAVVPGSGSDLISDAARLADAVVTGDVGHHQAVAALDMGIAVVDPGHIATERPGIEALLAMVAEAVDAKVVDLTGHDPTTWR